MDTALELKIQKESGQSISKPYAVQMLSRSELMGKLTQAFTPKPLYAVWRIIALSEIPYAYELDYTKQVVNYIENNLSTSSGFTLSGKTEDLLPCYNAMLIEAYAKMGIINSTVLNGIDWIKKYQIFNRNAETSWNGKGIKKYGGYMKTVPCYIGIVKTVKALAYYSAAVCATDNVVDSLICDGMDYVLSHRLYKRLSNGEPITKHILGISFPMSYQLNIVELIELAWLTGNIQQFMED